MTKKGVGRYRWIAAVSRNVGISMAVGIGFVFLVCVGRPQLWGWRLGLWGGLGGLAIYATCHFLDFAIGDPIRRRGIVPSALVGVPLYLLGGILGFLATTAVLQAARLMPFQLDLADLRMSLAISGGISIFVGLLFHSFHVMRHRLEESVRRIQEQEFAEKELELARSIQKRLLPPQQLSGEGYRIAARNLPARFVAGDFYDVFRLSDGTLGVVVADVSGKGMGASLIMASAKAVVPLIAEGRRASATLTELNRKLSVELAPREFVALAYARFDPSRGELELANAGLPDPFRIRPGQAPTTLGVPGPRWPLGVRAAVAYESLTVSLSSGDLLLLFTDGLPEAPTSAGEPLGYEALSTVLSKLEAESADGLLEDLFSSVARASPVPLEDDWTALVLQARGPS